METKHTPTPWTIHPPYFMTYADGILWINPDGKGDRATFTNLTSGGFLTIDETDDLGEYLATACNAHDDLVAALEATTAAAERFESLLITQWDMKPTKELTAAIASGLTALAKAKGEQS